MAKAQRKPRTWRGRLARRRIETLLLVATFIMVAAFLLSIAGAWPGSRSGAGSALPGVVIADSAGLGTRIRVEVLNGVGTPGLAERVTEWLRERGFDVVHYGNAAAFDRARSVVIDRSALEERARIVRDVLGIERLQSDLAPALYLDATVILGEDWAGLPDAERSSGIRVWAAALWRKITGGS